MLSDDDLAKIAALVAAIVRDELDRRNVKRSPDLTAAERMRRYRERKAKADRNVTSPIKRNATEGKSVTLRNADSNEDDRRAAWTAYAGAYANRYGVEPVRNAKVNSLVKKFCERIANGEAAQVAAFYLTHNKGIYVSSRHCVDLLLKDAEGLRMEWFTGRRGTQSEAKMADATQGRGNVWGKLIEEASRNGQ